MRTSEVDDWKCMAQCMLRHPPTFKQPVECGRTGRGLRERERERASPRCSFRHHPAPSRIYKTCERRRHQLGYNVRVGQIKNKNLCALLCHFYNKIKYNSYRLFVMIQSGWDVSSWPRNRQCVNISRLLITDQWFLPLFSSSSFDCVYIQKCATLSQIRRSPEAEEEQRE